jgi:hypothetical protein
MNHNDHNCFSAADAIGFLEAPLHAPDAPKLADIDSLTPAAEPGAARKRIAATVAVALCMGVIGFAFHLPLV